MMVHELTRLPENVLQTGLAALDYRAAEVGACVAAVLVSEAARLEIAYPRTAVLDLDPEFCPAAMPDGFSSLESQAGAARFLNSIAGLRANSFLVFTLKRTQRAVSIALGFLDTRPPRIEFPPGVLETLNLAAAAVLSLKETIHLRAELSRLNDRFARRKSVERAKGLLQSEHGITEQQAYEHLRKMSRQRRITLAEAAEDLLRAGARL